MRSWIRHSFKNRIFVTVLLVTLLPLLFCDVLVMQVQRARSESSLATQAQAQLNGLEQALDTTCLSYRQAAKRLCGSTMIDHHVEGFPGVFIFQNAALPVFDAVGKVAFFCLLQHIGG